MRAPQLIQPAIEIPRLSTWVVEQLAPIYPHGASMRAVRMMSLIRVAFFRRNPHPASITAGAVRGYSLIEQLLTASTFKQSTLRRALGEKYKAAMATFFDFQVRNEGYDLDLGLTKSYILRRDAVEMITALYRDEKSGIVVNRTTGNSITSASFPSSGILRPQGTGISVPAILPIGRDRLNDQIALEESAANGGLTLAMRAKVARRLRFLYAMRQYVRCIGGLPNLYTDARIAHGERDGNGRLWGIGEVHVQRLPRDVRAVVLGGIGWWDVDFKACHPTVLVALMKAYGLPCSAWQDYIDHRKQRVMELAEGLAIPQGKIKKILLAVIFGQPASTSPYTSLVKEIGSEAVQRLRENVFYLALREELREGRKAIIERHTEKFTVVNAVGKRRSTRKPAKRTSMSGRQPKRRREANQKLLSHVLTGYEAWAVRQVASNNQHILAIIHDGYIATSKPDTSTLEVQLRSASEERFGFDLDLKLETKEI